MLLTGKQQTLLQNRHPLKICELDLNSHVSLESATREPYVTCTIHKLFCRFSQHQLLSQQLFSSFVDFDPKN